MESSELIKASSSSSSLLVSDNDGGLGVSDGVDVSVSDGMGVLLPRPSDCLEAFIKSSCNVTSFLDVYLSSLSFVSNWYMVIFSCWK